MLFYIVLRSHFHAVSMWLHDATCDCCQCHCGDCSWRIHSALLGPVGSCKTLLGMQKLMPLQTVLSVLSAFIEIEPCPFHIPCVSRCRWICLRQGSAWHSKSMSQRGTNQHQRVETEAQTSKRPMIVTCREICAVDGSQLFSNGAFEVLSSVQLYLNYLT